MSWGWRTPPRPGARGRVAAADALRDLKDGVEDNDIDEFWPQFHNKAGARLNVHLDHGHMAQLHPGVSNRLTKFAAAVAAGDGG